jgi:hypothetical protein
VDANLKRTKRNRLLKEGNDDEIIFRRDEYSFNTIMHKHVYIYMNMHSYTYISYARWILRQNAIDEHWPEQTTMYVHPSCLLGLKEKQLCT